MTYVWAMLVSLLPKRYRAKSSLEGSRQLWRAAIFFSLGQTIVFSFISIATFIRESPNFWGQASIAVLNAEKSPAMDPVGVRLTTGVLGLTGYLLQPLHLFYAYMALEGTVRAFVSFAFGEILPTLPLGLVSAIHNRLESATRGKTLRALARDEILPARDDTYDLHVLSCRPKPEWSPYIGIHFGGELYILAGEESEKGSRPFGYRLRKSPAGDLVVVTCTYDPGKASK